MKKNIVVTLTDDGDEDFSTIVEDLQNEGMVVNKAYAFGVITGSVEEDLIQRLGDRKYVASVALEKMASIPHPDADIQ